jgi:hypothetical protein
LSVVTVKKNLKDLKMFTDSLSRNFVVNKDEAIKTSLVLITEILEEIVSIVEKDK